MATRSRIGIKEPNGTITSIYVHWDGYPSHHGPLLLNHYTTEESVRGLLALGDMSGLSKTVETSKFYARDRGEELTPAYNGDIESLNTEEYGYLFTPGEGWAWWDNGREMGALLPEHCEEAAMEDED